MAEYEVVDAQYVLDHLEGEHHIDVRPHSMYQAGFIPGSVNVEWEPVRDAGGDVAMNYMAKVAVLGIKPDQNLIVYCHDGVLTKQASQALADAGYRNIKAYIGSYLDWESDPSRPIEYPVLAPSGNAKADFKYEVVDAEYVMKHLSMYPIVDVRPKSMYQAAHVPGAINIEWEPVKEGNGNTSGRYTELALEHGLHKDKNVIVYCHNEEFTREASHALTEGGFKHIKAYVGSFGDWKSEPGRPVETWEAKKPLDRVASVKSASSGCGSSDSGSNSSSGCGAADPKPAASCGASDPNSATSCSTADPKTSSGCGAADPKPAASCGTSDPK